MAVGWASTEVDSGTTGSRPSARSLTEATGHLDCFGRRLVKGFLWCPHCGDPHSLTERECPVTRQPFQVHVARRHGRALRPAFGVVLDGKYRLLAKIGAGGMGTVFEAESLSLRRRLAVKIATRADARLEREAQLVSSLHHPNVCAAYDVGTTPWGATYVVLERLYGTTLAHRMRQGPMRTREVVEIVVQVLSGLEAAHAAGIVHRDMKPANVFLVERNGLAPAVKVLDFGFARDFVGSRDLTSITQPGWVCGTPAYMAPEQKRGKAVDHRADIYAVGIILFEALAERPLTQLSTDSFRRLLTSERRLELLRSNLPKAIADVVSRALAEEPGCRFPSAIAFQQALLRAMETSRHLEREPWMPAERLPRLADSETDSASTLPKLTSPYDSSGDVRPS